MKKYLLAAAVVALLPVPAFAQDYNDDTESESTARDGLRIEGRVWYERIGDPEDDVIYELGNGVAYGGEIGYDIAVSDTVTVGPFVGYDISSVEECDAGFCVSSKGYFSAGLQVGFATGGNGQAYLKGGYSQMTIDAVGPLDDGMGGTINIDDSQTGGGYEFAFGYEQGFGENFYARGEVGVGTVSDIYGFDFQRTHIGVALGARF